MKRLILLAAIVPLLSTLSADTHFYSEKTKEVQVSEQLDLIIKKMDVMDEILEFLKEEFSRAHEFAPIDQEFDPSAPIHPRIESTNW